MKKEERMKDKAAWNIPNFIILAATAFIIVVGIVAFLGGIEPDKAPLPAPGDNCLEACQSRGFNTGTMGDPGEYHTTIIAEGETVYCVCS